MAEVPLAQRRRDEQALPKYERIPLDMPLAAEKSSLSLSQLSCHDRNNFYFLTLLYYLQGVPVGLAFGSIPFLLKEKLSYAEVGIFSFASYPYSLKLLWSPVVDAFYSTRLGRRRSWILPIQFISSILLFYLSFIIEPLMADPQRNLKTITGFFLLLVLGCATQDIAVDGWALTLLSQQALPYASTAQTIGINSGYFTSFTVFLALNSPEFANSYLRRVPATSGLLPLSLYLRGCAVLYAFVTFYATFCRSEDRVKPAEFSGKPGWDSILRVYRIMLDILRLPAVKSLIIVHLFAKIAFQANDVVTNLKLVEKGLSKEDLALVILIDFPFEIVFGYIAAKWCTQMSPLLPWMYAFLGRVLFSTVSMSQVFFFPKSGTTFWYLLYVIIVHVANSFLSTVQFVSITALHTQIADPEVGGTYMTILNTICNFGGTWPRFFVLWGVDYFTSATCTNTGDSCATEELKVLCRSFGGQCMVHRDGYYVMAIICLLIGVIIYFGYIKATMDRLQHLPTLAWRCKKHA